MTKTYKSTSDHDCIKRIYLEGGSPWGFRVSLDNGSNSLSVSKVKINFFDYFSF